MLKKLLNRVTFWYIINTRCCWGVI